MSHPTPQIESRIAASGDHAEAWFASEVQVHESQLKTYLRGSFPAVRDVEDIVQESYLRLWRLRAVQSIHSAKGLLFTLARRAALDLVRRNRASPIDSVADLAALSAVEDGPNAAELLDRREKVRLLARAVALLPDRTREIVVLRKLEGLSQREVAARLNVSEAVVEHHVCRGLKRCEAYLLKVGVHSLYGHDER